MSRYEFEDDEYEPYVVIEINSGGVGSFLVGVAICAGLALLFATRSGLETRRDIRRRARRARRAAQKVATDVTDTVSGTFHDARRRVEEQIDSARDAVARKKEQVQ